MPALHLALDEQVSGRKAPLRAGVLPLGIADVVDHHAHDAAAAAVGLAGQRVSVVGRQPAGRGRFLRCCGRCGGLTGSRCLAGGCRLRGCRGRAVGELLPQPVGKRLPTAAEPAARQLVSASEAAASPDRRRTERRVIFFIESTSCRGKGSRRGQALPARKRAQIGFTLIVTILSGFVKRSCRDKTSPSRLRRDRSVA